MGLFDKKYCSICNAKIGLLGNKKVEDGNVCKTCHSKLSPFFKERRKSTVAQIQEQLDYREANLEKVSAFNVTRTLGDRPRVLIDEDKGQFLVTYSNKWQQDNPDVIDFSQVTGCHTEIKEARTELTYQDKDGKEVSYSPKRYDIDYDFFVTIYINSPWFDEISLSLNSTRVDVFGSVEYREYERQSNELKELFSSLREGVRERIQQDSAPKTAISCPLCGATTTPDANGRCEYCGGAITG